MTSPVIFTGGGLIDTTNAGGTPSGASITFSSTVDGGPALTLTGGTSGTVTLGGAVGATTAPSSLTATGATITQSSSVKTSGAVSYNASTLNLGGNITTSGGVITMTGPANLTTSAMLRRNECRRYTRWSQYQLLQHHQRRASPNLNRRHQRQRDLFGRDRCLNRLEQPDSYRKLHIPR